MAIVTYGAPAGVTTDALNQTTFSDSDVVSTSNTAIVMSSRGIAGPLLNSVMESTLQGSFTWNGAQLTGGTANFFQIRLNGALLLEAKSFALPVATIVQYADDVESMFAIVLGGDDSIAGGGLADNLDGFGGADTISGGAGNDTIFGDEGVSYLRGDDGNDTITGGSAFDDINGNMGDDVARGGLGDDWVVGGKDQDQLWGEGGSDIVYGNLGNDTCSGGDGADIVRGGQQNDVLDGGAGDDWLSGDRDNDTISGGAGADVFHTFGEAGVDRVLDFNRAQGDRVMVDPGDKYTVAQVGADVVISLTGGAQMTLVGVQMSSLTGDWIFGA